MTKKKRPSGPPPKPAAAKPAAPKKRPLTWVVAAVIVAGIVVVVALSGTNKGATDASGGGWGKPTADPDEARYIGRLLPAGYAEPKLTDAFAYAQTTPMTEVTMTKDADGLSLPVADVVSKRNVTFKYARPTGDTIPIIAYVKPSGALFAGVSFCPPCEGELQRIEPDSTLTCESCGTKRDLESGVGLSGPCKLYPLDEVPAKVVGDKLVLDTGVLDSWTAQPKDRRVGG